MRITKRLFSISLACILLLSAFPVITNAACSHSSLGTKYSEATHPHYYYRTCNSCGTKVYVGGNATKAHGDGTWGSGTCPSCGTHTYNITSTQSTHPHKSILTCSCGSTKTQYAMQYSCSSCKANTRTISKTTPTQGILSYIDSDLDIGIPITLPVTYNVTYTNTYNRPNQVEPNYSRPAFASFYSKVSSYVTGSSTAYPSIDTVSYPTVYYYNSTGSNAASQSLIFNAALERVSQPGVLYTLTFFPNSAVGRATCNFSGSSIHITGYTTAYFS